MPGHVDANNLRNKHRLLEKRSMLRKQQALDPKKEKKAAKETDASGAAGGDPNNPTMFIFSTTKT